MPLFAVNNRNASNQFRNGKMGRLAKPIENFQGELIRELQKLAPPISGDALCELFAKLERELLYPTLYTMFDQVGLRADEEWQSIARTYYATMTNALEALLVHDVTLPFATLLRAMSFMQDNVNFRSFLKQCQNVNLLRANSAEDKRPVSVESILSFIAPWPAGSLECLQTNGQLTFEQSHQLLMMLFQDIKNTKANYPLLIEATNRAVFDGYTPGKVNELLQKSIRVHALIPKNDDHSLANIWDTLCQNERFRAALPPAEDIVYGFLHEGRLWLAQPHSHIAKALAAVPVEKKWPLAKRYLEAVVQARASTIVNYPIEDLGYDVDMKPFALEIAKVLLMPDIENVSPIAKAEIVNFWEANGWIEDPVSDAIYIAIFERIKNEENLRAFLCHVTNAGKSVLQVLSQYCENMKNAQTLCTIVNNNHLMQALEDSGFLLPLQRILFSLTLPVIADVIRGVHVKALLIFEKILQTKPSLINLIRSTDEVKCLCLSRGLLWSELFQPRTLSIEQKLQIFSALQLESAPAELIADIIEKIKDDFAGLCSGDLDALLPTTRLELYDLLQKWATAKMTISEPFWMAISPALEKPGAMSRLIGLNRSFELTILANVTPIFNVILANPAMAELLMNDLRGHMSNENIDWILNKLPTSNLRVWMQKIPEFVEGIKHNPDLVKLAISKNISDAFTKEMIEKPDIFSMDEWCKLLPSIQGTSGLREKLIYKLKQGNKHIPRSTFIQILIRDRKVDFFHAVLERLSDIDAMQVLSTQLCDVSLPEEQRFAFMVTFSKVPEFVNLAREFWSSANLPILGLLKNATEAMLLEEKLLDTYLLPCVLHCQKHSPYAHAIDQLIERFPMSSVLASVFNHAKLKPFISNRTLGILLQRPAGPVGIDQISERQRILADTTINGKRSIQDWVSLFNDNQITLEKLLFSLAERCVAFPATLLETQYEAIHPTRRHWLLSAVLAKMSMMGSNVKQTVEGMHYQTFVEKVLTKESSIALYGVHNIPLTSFKYLYQFACRARWVDTNYIVNVLTQMQDAPLERVEVVLSPSARLDVASLTITEIYDEVSRIPDELLRDRLLRVVACTATVTNKLPILNQSAPFNRFPAREVVLNHIAEHAGAEDAITPQPSHIYPVTDSRFCGVLASAVASHDQLKLNELITWLSKAKDPSPLLFKRLQPALNKVEADMFLSLLIHCPNLSNQMLIAIMSILVNEYHIKTDLPSMMECVRTIPRDPTIFPNQMGFRLAKAKYIYQSYAKIIPHDEAYVKGREVVDKYKQFARDMNANASGNFVVEPDYCYAENLQAFVPEKWFSGLQEKKDQLTKEQNLMRKDGWLIITEMQALSYENVRRSLPSFTMPAHPAPEHLRPY